MLLPSLGMQTADHYLRKNSGCIVPSVWPPVSYAANPASLSPLWRAKAAAIPLTTRNRMSNPVHFWSILISAFALNRSITAIRRRCNLEKTKYAPCGSCFLPLMCWWPLLEISCLQFRVLWWRKGSSIMPYRKGHLLARIRLYYYGYMLRHIVSQ